MTEFELLAMCGLVLAVMFAHCWILLSAFRTSLVWGLGALLIPLIAAIFALSHWERCQKPVLLWLAAFGTLTAWSLADPGFWVR